MKRPGLIAILIMFLGSMSGTSYSQAANKAEIESIDAYCKTVDAIQDKTAGLVLADTAGLNDDTPKWRGFASEKALEKFREDSDTYSIAYNWRKGTKIVASNFTLFSDSGDWAKYVYHCFREDGSLARVESELRTFYGDYIVTRRNYFDRSGKRLSRSVKFRDLTSGKPKKPESGGVEGDDPNEIDYYKQTSKLPFAHLVK